MKTCAECQRGIHMFCEARRAQLRANKYACGCLDTIHASNRPEQWRAGIGELNRMALELLDARKAIADHKKSVSELEATFDEWVDCQCDKHLSAVIIAVATIVDGRCNCTSEGGHLETCPQNPIQWCSEVETAFGPSRGRAAPDETARKGKEREIMSTLRITVKMDNAAFDDPGSEVTSVLEDIGPKITDGENSGKIHDTNGNTVGEWRIGR